MSSTTNIFCIKALTSLHAGSGNDLGVVDLPIQREKHTTFPKIESSSLKGSLREALESITIDKKANISKDLIESLIKNDENFDVNLLGKLNYNTALQYVFGYDEDGLGKNVKEHFNDNTEFAGAINFTDARILFFPIKSARNVFAYATCPYVLERFSKDAKIAGKQVNITNFDVRDGNAIVHKDSKLLVNGAVILEEYTFTATIDDTIKNQLVTLKISKEIIDRLIVLSDNDFKDFVNLSTEVITRTKINNSTGTVQPGALFNEEYLPAESVLYFITIANNIFKKDDKLKIFKTQNQKENELVMNFFEKALPEFVQIGGNATLGKGIVNINKMEL